MILNRCRFIRDRLHERCRFFRLWPVQLQQLLCRLARPVHMVQNEILAGQGSRPQDLCFILEGEAAIALRSAIGSSLLKDVAKLHTGDTYGELSLLGVKQHPAFVVVRSKQFLAASVNADELAQAMAQQQRDKMHDIGVAGAAGLASAELRQQPQEQQGKQALYRGQLCINVDALYKMIGEEHGKTGPVISPNQAVRVRRIQLQQLQDADAAVEQLASAAWQPLAQKVQPTRKAHSSDISTTSALAQPTERQHAKAA
eukprot:GHRR01015827.1.p1 GENE.GHRR01015827.1~~GHRR01015827.1.p1  ORF type:complete len:257 (+),score=102.41 GHRR01015827.1:502-1272(+)